MEGNGHGTSYALLLRGLPGRFRLKSLVKPPPNIPKPNVPPGIMHVMCVVRWWSVSRTGGTQLHRAECADVRPVRARWLHEHDTRSSAIRECGIWAPGSGIGSQSRVAPYFLAASPGPPRAKGKQPWHTHRVLKKEHYNAHVCVCARTFSYNLDFVWPPVAGSRDSKCSTGNQKH